MTHLVEGEIINLEDVGARDDQIRPRDGEEACDARRVDRGRPQELFVRRKVGLHLPWRSSLVDRRSSSATRQQRRRERMRMRMRMREKEGESL